jgi:Protein of unknown function (DUF2652)/Polyketide cyclase / dehydrase and lipid transport
MSSYLPEAQRGCLLLADITGYTDYLQGSELEHAQDVLADLLETIIGGIEPPFEVAKLEGDAVFAHMPAADVDFHMLFDTIDATYFAFRRRLRDVVHGTTCNCDACVLIPSLDLKFFVHSGSYVVRRIGRTEELTGSDVVLVHRLLKGTARSVVGNDAYLVVTEAAMVDVGGNPETLGLVAHVEQLDVGDTTVYIDNLQDRWEAEEHRTRETVTDAAELAAFTHTFPGSPQDLWQWYSDPRKRLEWQGGLIGIDEVVEGRRGIGTVNHCAHGDRMTIQHVVDWQPFTQFTTRDVLEGMGIALKLTYVFTPVDDETHVTTHIACEPEAAFAEIREMFEPMFIQNSERLRALLTHGNS